MDQEINKPQPEKQNEQHIAESATAFSAKAKTFKATKEDIKLEGTKTITEAIAADEKARSGKKFPLEEPIEYYKEKTDGYSHPDDIKYLGLQDILLLDPEILKQTQWAPSEQKLIDAVFALDNGHHKITTEAVSQKTMWLPDIVEDIRKGIEGRVYNGIITPESEYTDVRRKPRIYAESLRELDPHNRRLGLTELQIRLIKAIQAQPVGGINPKKTADILGETVENTKSIQSSISCTLPADLRKSFVEKQASQKKAKNNTQLGI